MKELIEVKTMEKWKIRLDGDYQRAVDKFVQREVIYCVSYLNKSHSSEHPSFTLPVEKQPIKLYSEQNQRILYRRNHFQNAPQPDWPEGKHI